MNVVQESDYDHTGAFISAIENNDLDTAKKILAIDNRNKCIYKVGVLQVTALHVAAWRGSIDLLNLLYERGADVNDMDKIGRTALYYAAYNGNAEVTKWLVERGADVNAKVGVHSCARDIPYSAKHRDVGKKLPLPVCWGRTPLHQAVKNNHADIVRILIAGNADADVQDDHNITPLLLAGSAINRDNANEMVKFVEIIETLVLAKVTVDSVHPSTGTTALHHAAMLGSSEATKILLANGAEPMYRCSSSGSTPLHIAANSGSCKTLMVLLKAMPLDIDTPDQINRTALHIAAYQGHRDCVRALINYGANLAAMTNTGVTAVSAIFSHISRPLEFLKNILDSCVQPSNRCRWEKCENIVVDFKILAPKCQMQMAVVTAIVAATSNTAQLAILQHPLVETFLRLKWARLRRLFFGFMIVHLLFVISLSLYGLMNVQHSTRYIMINQGFLMFFSCLILFHNIIQVTLKPKHYLRQFETWLSFVSATLALATSATSDFAMSKHNNRSEVSTLWVLHFISLAILMSWMHMMLLIGRVPMWGYYALMFSTVLKNIVKVLLAFCCLIIGFAFSFAIVFYKQNEFRNFWNSILKTMVMMMGEYEYGELFHSNNTMGNEMSGGTFLPVTGKIIFSVFVIIASIVLINLMIGLAVNDIQGLEKEGHIHRLLKQAEFVAHLERVTSRVQQQISAASGSSKWLLRPIIKLFSKRDISTKITLASRESYHRMSHLLEKPIPEIPADLMDALFLLAHKSPFSNDSSADENVEVTGRLLVSMLSNLEKQIQNLKVYSYRNLANRKSMKRNKSRKIIYKKKK